MKHIKKYLLPIAFCGVTVFGGIANAQTKWDVPTSYAPSIFLTQNLQKMADDIEKESGGKLKLTLHTNASLFKLNEIKRAVQTGQAQVGDLLVSGLENENKAFAADTVPFLAASHTDARKLWLASKPVYEEILSKQGLKLLYSVAWPANALFSKKPINSIADLKGLKWRAYSPATARFGELLGTQPVTVATAELAQAVATGTVDVLATASPVAVQLKLAETMSYYYAIDAWLPKGMVVVNNRAFAALDKPTQEIVLKAAAAAENRGWMMSEEVAKEALAALSKSGMKVLPPTPQFKAELDRIGKTMLNEWLLSAGADGQKILDAYHNKP